MDLPFRSYTQYTSWNGESLNIRREGHSFTAVLFEGWYFTVVLLIIIVDVPFIQDFGQT